MTLELALALAGFAFVTSVTPGPNNLMLMTSGANFGFRRTIPHMLGVGVGFCVMIVLVGLGLAALFDTYRIARQLLTVVSVGYLLWLAWKIANANAPTRSGAARRPFTFLQAALFQWVNPKAWSMALTAVTLYTDDGSVRSVLMVSLIFGAINLPSVGSLTLLGQQMRRFLNNPARLKAFNITMAVLLIGSLALIL
ncbi:MAG: LysE family translocator [Pseudomonadota bacterium]